MQRGSLNQQYIGAIGNQLAQLFAPADNSKKMQYMLQGSQIAENDSQVRYNDAGTGLRTQEWGRREQIATTDVNDPRQNQWGQSLATGASDFQGGLAKLFDTGTREAARDAYTKGDYTAGNRQMMAVASGPTKVVSDIGGYFGNEYDTGTALRASGITNARIGQANAAAGASNASAANSYASAAKTKDEMSNPGKYRAPAKGAGGGLDVKYTDSQGVDKLIDFYLPKDAVNNLGFPVEVGPQTRNKILAVAQRNMKARSSVGADRYDSEDVAMAVQEVLGGNLKANGLAAAFEGALPPMANPTTQPAAQGGLTPEEQAELEQLRQSLGRK